MDRSRTVTCRCRLPERLKMAQSRYGSPRISEGKLPTRIIGSAADNSCRIGKPELAMGPRLDPPSRLAPATEERTPWRRRRRQRRPRRPRRLEKANSPCWLGRINSARAIQQECCGSKSSCCAEAGPTSCAAALGARPGACDESRWAIPGSDLCLSLSRPFLCYRLLGAESDRADRRDKGAF
jgi:hypothetical protein